MRTAVLPRLPVALKLPHSCKLFANVIQAPVLLFYTEHFSKKQPLMQKNGGKWTISQKKVVSLHVEKKTKHETHRHDEVHVLRGGRQNTAGALRRRA